MQGNGGETPKIKYTLKAKTSGGKLQGNWGKLKKSILRRRKVQEQCSETGGKLKNTFLRPRIVQGNWGVTQKIIFQA